MQLKNSEGMEEIKADNIEKKKWKQKQIAV